MPEIVGRLRPPRLSSAPASPAVGEMYYSTVGNILYWWNGTTWISASGGTALPADVVNPAATRLIADFAVGTDTQPIYRLYGSGKQEWGVGGTTAPDTNLYRSSGNVLATDYHLLVGQRLFFGSQLDASISRIGAGYLRVWGTSLEVQGPSSNFWAYGQSGSGLYSVFGDVSGYLGGGNQAALVLGEWATRIVRQAAGQINFVATAYFSTDLVIASYGIPAETRLYFNASKQESMWKDTNGVLRTNAALRAEGNLLASYGYGQQVEVGNTGSGAGILFGSGGDAFIARDQANHLKTEGLILDCNQTGKKLYLSGALDTALYRFAANNIRTDGAFRAVSQLEAGSHVWVGAGNDAGRLYFGINTDTALYRWGAGIVANNGSFYSNNAASGIGFGTIRTGDARLRWFTTLDGQMQWGDGVNAPDIILYRSSPGILFMTGNLYTSDTLTIGYSTPSNAILWFGNAYDTSLYRAAAGVLRSTNQLWVDGPIYTFAREIIANKGLANQVGIGDVWYGYPAINFGPSNDTAITRIAAGQLLVNNCLHLGGNYQAGVAGMGSAIAFWGASAPPASNPASGGILYALGDGTLLWRLPNGAEIALARP